MSGQIERLQAHDHEAWASYLRELGPPVARYARAAGHRDPAEVVSAVFETMARRIHEFEGGPAQLRSFVFTVAHARIVDDHRRRSRAPAPLPEFTAESQPAPDWLLEALEELAPLQREVIEWRFLRERSVAETARQMGRSPGAVRALTSRGLAALRDRLMGPTDAQQH